MTFDKTKSNINILIDKCDYIYFYRLCVYINYVLLDYELKVN